MVAVAADEGWSITLHLMRKDGPSDPSNQHWIRRYCEKYPDMQLILARCARGFNPYQAMKGLSGLTGLDNLWVDTSAVCSPMSIEAVLRTIGPERTLYGSDYPVSHCRGTNFPVADSFMWVYEDTPIWGGAKWTLLRPALIGLENLLATKMACWSLGLSDSQIEGIFWRNSAQVLGIQ
ncbi:MAG: hypothetical protein A2Z18_03825 [Armatimonadetes bacterium RBG_16_58_9]|nr:MAG: hypothetical protein A2Z18_03825 [Armatimonadetes bacterium RBG_16_58_9]